MLRKDELRGNAERPSSATSQPDEVARFNALAEEWWKPDGKFRVVHAFNAERVAYLKAHLSELFPDRLVNAPPERPLQGLRIADIGCGAGLVPEPLAAAGADVFAIDAAERNIAIAQHHAARSGVDITYKFALPETLGEQHMAAYDAVLSLEVVEHVADLPAFLKAIAALVRPGGVLIIGTLNRTAKSFALGIVGAEYVLGLLPRGTHDWRAFVKPTELATHLRPLGFRDHSIVGVSMNPVTWAWSTSGDTSVNYLKTLRKAPGELLM